MANFDYGEELDSVFMPKSGITVDANAITAPDGTLTADRIVSSNTTISYLSPFHDLEAAGANCINVFAKENNSGYGLTMTNFNYDPANGNSYFDLVNGVVGTPAAGADATLIEDMGDGWYRCTVVLTTTDLSGNWRFYISDGDGDPNTPVGASIYVWGAYSNPGATPASYVSQAGIAVPLVSGRSFVRNTVRNTASNIIRNTVT